MKYLWEFIYLHLFPYPRPKNFIIYNSQTSQINVKECVMLSNMLLFPLRIREEMIYKDSCEVDVEPFVDGSLLSSHRLCKNIINDDVCYFFPYI